jgi:hypothetical protein
MTAPGGALSRLKMPALDPAVSLLAAALVSIAVLTWTGFRSARAAGERRVALTRAKTELAGFEDLRTRYAPAIAAESLSWRQTWVGLRDIGVLGSDRLGLTGTVSRVAEESGLRDVRVLIGPPDTTGVEARLSTGGIQRKSAPFGLLVEARGGMQAVISFIGRLPPSVAVTQLSLVQQNGGRRHRISLAVYELEFTNGSPPIPADVWSPVEPRAPGGGVGGRPGG